MELNLDWRGYSSEIWDDVSYEIRPLKVWAFQELLSFWETSGRQAEGEEAVIRVSPSDSAGLMAVAKRIFPDHVRKLSGLTVVEEGRKRKATLESLCEETAMMQLAGEIVSRLIAISEISGNDEKN